MLTCTLAAAGLIWFQQRSIDEFHTTVAEGVIATAEAPVGVSLQIEAVTDISPLEAALPQQMDVIAAGSFTMNGAFPSEGVLVGFNLTETDPSLNYVVGHLDNSSGKWEFARTIVDEDGRVTATVPHFSIWSLLVVDFEATMNTLSKAGDFKRDVHNKAWNVTLGESGLALMADPPNCDLGNSSVPPWAVTMANVVDTDVLKWCSQSDAGGNLLLRVVNNNSWPMPVKLPVEPDKISMDDEEGVPLEDPYIIRTNDGSLVLPALSEVVLTYTELGIAEELTKGLNQVDTFPLVTVDGERSHLYGWVESLLDFISVAHWGVSFTSPTIRAAVITALLEKSDCRPEEQSACIDPLQVAAKDWTAPDLVGQLGAGNTLGAWWVAHVGVSPRGNPPEFKDQVKVASKATSALLQGLSFGTIFAQGFRTEFTDFNGGTNIDLSIQLPYLDYMTNVLDWTEYQDPNGYVSFPIRKDWKVKNVPLKDVEGFNFMDEEGAVISIFDKNQTEIATLTTGLTDLNIEGSMPIDEESGAPLEVKTLVSQPLPQLDSARSKSQRHTYGGHSFEAFALQKSGSSTVVEVGASIVNGPSSMPYWQFSQNSYAIFSTSPLVSNGLLPSKMSADRFTLDPLYFELKRMMTGVQFTAKAEPKIKKQAEETALPDPVVCTGEKFDYEGMMTAQDCTQAKEFVQEIAIDANLVTKGWVSISGAGGCMFEADTSYLRPDGFTCRMSGGRSFNIYLK